MEAQFLRELEKRDEQDYAGIDSENGFAGLDLFLLERNDEEQVLLLPWLNLWLI